MLTSRQNGFSLIELLLVVLIIGILATIAIPKLRNTKDKAKLATVKAELHSSISTNPKQCKVTDGTPAATNGQMVCT